MIHDLTLEQKIEVAAEQIENSLELELSDEKKQIRLILTQFAKALVSDDNTGDSGLHLQRVSCMLPSEKDIDEAVCKHYDDDDTSLAIERLAFANGAEWCKEQIKELLSNCS